MDLVLLLTDVVTLFIYGALSFVLFLFLFIERSISISQTGERLGIDTPFVWYPFVSSLSMAKLGGNISAAMPSVVSSVGLVAVLIFTAIKAIIERSLDATNAKLCVIFYAVYSLSHLVVLWIYMRKCHPEKTPLMIIISSLFPFLKLFIHLDLRDKSQKE